MTAQTLIRGLFIVCALVARAAGAQNADEHASHHPAGAGGQPVPSPSMSAASMAPDFSAAGKVPNAPATSMGTTPTNVGGMMGAMGSMMAPMSGTPSGSGGCMGEGCGSSGGKTPIYSSLMTLPALNPQKRAEIETLANTQLNQGTRLLNSGAESFRRAALSNDYLSMQNSLGVMQEGLDSLNTGISGRRVLIEGKAPRNLALDWFKREMNLASPIGLESEHYRSSLTLFHTFAMVLLITFAIMAVSVYVLKMRRTVALFKRLEDGERSLPQKPQQFEREPTPHVQQPSTNVARVGVVSEEVAAPWVPGLVHTPVAAGWKGQLRIGRIITETPDVKTFRLLPVMDDSRMPFVFEPGQFLNATFWIGGARMTRSYSISSSPLQTGHVDITVKREPRGAVSRHMHDLLKVGDLIEIAGPVGRFVFNGSEADSIVLIAGGVGITPLMSTARYLTETAWPGEIFLIYGCRAPEDYIFSVALAALEAQNARFHLTVTMSRAEPSTWCGAVGRITQDLLTRNIPNLAARRVHLCGPPAMMESTKLLLATIGVPPAQVRTEAFGASKPEPDLSRTTVETRTAGTGPVVTFSRSNKAANVRLDQTILELADELAIAVDSSCRIGSCGICKIMLLSGNVEMAVDNGLTEEDKALGFILACQARPKGPVSVEA